MSLTQHVSGDESGGGAGAAGGRGNDGNKAGRSSGRRLVALTFVLVFLSGMFVPRLLAQMGARSDFWAPVRDIKRQIDDLYVDQPDSAKLQRGAITGMLEALDDPYAEYIPAEDLKEFEKQMTGSFVGIGCAIEIRDGWLTVVSPLEDSPAFTAGILAGDRISDIDGKTTHGLTAEACIKMLTGEPGTQVKLTVMRDGQEIPYTLTRAKIVSKSVRGYRRLPDGSGHWEYLIDPANRIAYVRMSQFTPTSDAELLEAIKAAQEQAERVDVIGTGKAKLAGLILDLRNNPGGYMDAALRIADMFIADGVIMSIRGRSTPTQTFRASGEGEHFSFPICVMVNGSSASASEIVSGALQDHDRAVVLGTRTFGKGLVQSVQTLEHDPGSQVKFTTQRYYLPSGRLIQRTDESDRWGVDPTPGYYVPMSDQDTLAWLLRRRDWDILRKDTAALPVGMKAEQLPPPVEQQKWNDPEWVKTTAKDPQLAAALKATQARASGGAWVKVSDEADQHGKIAMKELQGLEKTRDRLTKEFARLDKRIETLEKVAASEKATAQMPDLWPDTLDLTGGRIEVLDKDGKVVADLRITGRDVERWVSFADVEKSGDNAESGGEQGKTPPKTPAGEPGK